MKLSERILTLLSENPDGYTSGNEIAERLAVSRNAVWKAVEKLRSDGYEIDAITNKGYRIHHEPDRLSAGAVMKLLPQTETPFQVAVVESIPSTNDALRLRAEDGAPEGTILIAESQTSGRGRLNRSFYSPKNSGVYLSALLRPTIPAQEALSITTAAAVAASEAIESCCGVDTKIKWVNDIFANGKKIAGILTEAAINLENGRLDYAVLGIGINISDPENGWPAELTGIAGGALGGYPEDRRGLRSLVAGTFLNLFWHYYRNLGGKSFLSAYRARSLVLGREIIVDDGVSRRPATALAIDEEFRLIVRFDGESRETALSTGEVSVRIV